MHKHHIYLTLFYMQNINTLLEQDRAAETAPKQNKLEDAIRDRTNEEELRRAQTLLNERIGAVSQPSVTAQVENRNTTEGGWRNLNDLVKTGAF